MKLVRYLAPWPRWGLLEDGIVAPLGSTMQTSEEAALAWMAGQPATEAQPGQALPLASLQLLPPLASHATIYCIGLNYLSHVAETGRDLPQHPTVFIRTAASLVGTGAALVRPRSSTQFDYEGEVAVIIGHGGRHIPQAQALSHVGAVTCLNDGSVRDYQQHSLAAGKNFHQSGAFGPWLVRPAQAGDLGALAIATRLNGNVVQQSTTASLIFSIPFLISYLSDIVTLRPGDVIATGTPEGVGFRRNPPTWLQPGDVIEVEVGGVGCLTNRIEDEAPSEFH